MSSSRSSKYNFSDHEYITLISAEGFEFIISKRAASGSKMLREMMTSAKGLFGEMNQISLPDISSRALEIICDYLCERRIRGVYLSNFKPFSSLDPTSKEDRELVVELLLAANYMDC